jgi:hypothetical protein
MFDLTGLFTTSGSEATLRYQVLNRSPEPVFVAHLPIDATFKQYPNRAYTALSADGERLTLLLGNSPLPLDREVEYGVSALFVRVAPGAQMSGEIRVPFPDLEWNAFFLPLEEVEADLVTVSQVVLEVDVIPQRKATRVQAANSPPDHWWVVGQPIRLTVRLTSESPLPVRKRHDNFPRS